MAIVALMFGVLVVTLPSHGFHIGVVPGFIPALDAGMMVCDLISAAILYAQAVVFRSRALTVLASGYALSGLLLIPWGLTYPGAFSDTGLLGAKINTTGWIAVTWRMCVPLAILLYAWLKRRDSSGLIADRPPAAAFEGLMFSIVLAIGITLLTTLGHDLLPSFFVSASVAIPSVLDGVNILAIAATIAAMVALLRQERTVLDLWLLVALSGWLAQSLLNLQVHSRVVLGAYVFLGLTLISNLIVMLALVTESNQLYARLAVSAGARRREREARLMSMDAITAAISHEVGQPLTAVTLNAAAGLTWLTQRRPDVKKAAAALRAVSDDGRRTFDIIKSIRASFAKDSRRATEFSLNDLVEDTVRLVERELAASKISLDLSLDEALPSIIADRVQIQRVIVNLLNNAIDALRATSDRKRTLSICSSVADGNGVLLEVSDNGTGIEPENIDQIFDPFFTTKGTGTGLGLPLCRTIAEEHQGQLLAFPGDAHGALFQLRLPRSRLP